MNKSNKRLVLLELNEINFDVAKKYVERDPQGYAGLRRLMSSASITTQAEANYDEQEPWIQWVSVHTGLSYAEHGVFRLGDIVKCRAPQLFERLESGGLSVGGISAMNAENRLHAPKYFIPDPWTNTASDTSWWSRRLHQAISQAVNDNAEAKVSAATLMTVALATLRFARARNYPLYAKLLRRARGAPWRKALFLDLLLSDIHSRLWQQRSPDFSCLFLNAGAHIQHHYFHSSSFVHAKGDTGNPSWYVSSKEDPLKEMFDVYDAIITNLLDEKNTEVVIATGLSQKPYDRTKYYYRLRDHHRFLTNLGLTFDSVHPRMTRDFLIQFSTEEQAREAQGRLAALVVQGSDLPLFGELELKSKELFVTLTYPREITSDTCFLAEGRSISLHPEVVFVAIKNGMHQSKGFAYFTPGVAKHAPACGSHVKQLHGTVLSYFGLA